MSSVNGNFQEDMFATIAAADAGLDTWVTALDARLQDLSGGDTATRARGTIALEVTAENAAGNEYTHKISTTFDTGTQAAGAPDATIQTIITALDTYADAVAAAGDYDAITVVKARASITIND